MAWKASEKGVFEGPVEVDEATTCGIVSNMSNKKRYAEQRMINGQLEMVTTNNVKTFWSMLKRGYQGVFHKISPKQLHRYVDEATGHRNMRNKDTDEIMGEIARSLADRFLTYDDLTANNRYYSAARGCEPKEDKRLL